MSDVLVIIMSVSIVTGLIYIVYMLLLSAGQPQAKPDLQITTKDIFEQCKILFDQKKFGIVDRLARKYLEKNPAHTELRSILAKSYNEQGRIYDAMSQAEIVVRRKPANYSMRIFLANCYKKTSQSSRAISELKEVLRLEPNNVTAIQELAQTYLETNQKQSAIKMFARLLEFVDNNLEILKTRSIMAQLYTEINDFVSAISEYKTVLEIYPENNDIKKNLVELYQKNSNALKAIEMCEALLATLDDAKEQLWAISHLIDLSLSLNKSDQALEYINKALENPAADKVALKEKVAEVYVIMGKIDESIQILNELSSDDSENITLKRALAKTYQVKKEYALATEIYKEILDIAGAEEVLAIHREISNIFANWALDLYERGENSECFKTFTIALHYDCENPRIFYMLGHVNQLILNFNEAISQFKKALEFDNSNPTYYMALAECYAAVNNVYEEKKALMDALCYDDHNAPAHFKLALLNIAQNDVPSAIISLRRAIELDSAYEDAKYKLALLLERQGERDEAISVYEEILKNNPTNDSVISNLKMLKGE